MAFVHLKNSRLTDIDLVDFTKTKTERLASEKIGKDLYRQVHHVVFTEKSGKTIEVITSNDASNAECSMSKVISDVLWRAYSSATACPQRIEVAQCVCGRD